MPDQTSPRTKSSIQTQQVATSHSSPAVNRASPVPRVSAIASQLAASAAPQRPMAQHRAPITCHVLDTTTGRPAAFVHVSLTLLRPLGPSAPFTATTDSDGRVKEWEGQAGPSLDEIFTNAHEHSGGQMVWALKFNTGEYFGEGKTFFPEVEIRFFVRGPQEHYHVPLLLGPWSYTTYRGS